MSSLKSGRSRQSASPRRSVAGRENKIYRTPPTPPPPEMDRLERSFTLDCIAVSSISHDYSKTNPKLGPALPPYNSKKDNHATNYFNFIGVPRTLAKTKQTAPGTSIEGPVIDRFVESGKGHQYLSKRNYFGAGHSRETTDGHAQFMQGARSFNGYNGHYGYRRNTPWLRASASPFGTASASPTH
ncbi:hypothetical protein LSAT2_026824 [Lamellibrachia satsuma]|nr:hypothetical protein LSAT2_026824 [Lamellibrachia satsuma]